MVDDHSVDVPPADHMLVVRNDDVPGMIAAVTGRLGEAGVNIDDMHLGRSAAGTAALMVLATDVAVPEEVPEAIRALPGPVSADRLSDSPLRQPPSDWLAAARRPRPAPRRGTRGPGWGGRTCASPAGSPEARPGGNDEA